MMENVELSRRYYCFVTRPPILAGLCTECEENSSRILILASCRLISCKCFRYRIYNNPYEPKPRKPIDSYIKRLGLQCNRQLFQHLHIHNTTYSLQKKKISWKKNTKKNQWWNIKKKIYIFVISLLLIYLFWSCSFELCKKIFEYKSEAAYSSKESMKHCCTIAFRILE